MFDKDRWQEVWETMQRHKLRTFLTGLSVAWGIFMLVLLQGAGNGLRNATMDRFADDATNSIRFAAGQTSLPFAGTGPGRKIRLNNRDYQTLLRQDGVEKLTGRFYIPGTFTVSYKNNHSSFDIRAVHPDHLYLEKTEMVSGRFLNSIDLAEKRKVAVIGEAVADTLFDEPTGRKDPIGERIAINNTSYLVVGTYVDQGSEGEMRKIYLPITTAQTIYNGKEKIDQIMFTVGDANLAETQRIEEQVRNLFARVHRFDPADKRALRVRNNMERTQKFLRIFDLIAVFVWIIGIGTIIAGIVGVSNIMMISVRERTKEFGVRKAIGARPGSIVGLVVQEAVVLTSVSGYLGLVGGVGLLELGAKFLPENEFLKNPTIDFRMAVTAIVLLVLAGALAGFFPARKASRVNPIVALRNG